MQSKMSGTEFVYNTVCMVTSELYITLECNANITDEVLKTRFFEGCLIRSCLSWQKNAWYNIHGREIVFEHTATSELLYKVL